MSIKASFLIELNLESEVEVLTYGSFLLNKLPIFAEWSKLIDLLPGLTPPHDSSFPKLEPNYLSLHLDWMVEKYLKNIKVTRTDWASKNNVRKN